jgi:hypothetical protein
MSDPLPRTPPQIAETVKALTDAHADTVAEAARHAQNAAQSREDRLEALTHALDPSEPQNG